MTEYTNLPVSEDTGDRVAELIEDYSTEYETRDDVVAAALDALEGGSVTIKKTYRGSTEREELSAGESTEVASDTMIVEVDF